MQIRDLNEKRIAYLQAVAEAALEYAPDAPFSACFGLWDEHSGSTSANERPAGFVIGENLGLSKQEVKSIVLQLASQPLHYLQATLGLRQFYLTPDGLEYVLSLGKGMASGISITNNSIVMGDNANASIHQGYFSSEGDINGGQHFQIVAVMGYIIQSLSMAEGESADELRAEANNLKRDVERGRDIGPRGKILGRLLKEMGMELPANLCSGSIKHWLGWE